MLELIDFAIVSASHGAQAAGGDQGLSPGESLTAAITMEGLLFASFAVADKLTEATTKGRNRFFTQGWFSWCIVAALLFVAAAGCAAWVETFGFGRPSNLGEGLVAFGLAAGIVSQPVFAAVINWQAKGS